MNVCQYILMGLLLMFNKLLFSQTTLTGFVREGNLCEQLIFATVVVEELYRGTTTDIEGYFRLDSLPAGKYTLRISCFAYESFRGKIVVTTVERPPMTYYLNPSVQFLDYDPESDLPYAQPII